jgi:hypothetical protein
MIQGVDPRNDPRKIAQRHARRYGADRTVGRTTKSVLPPRTVAGAARELMAPELRTLAFRKVAYGVHDYSGVEPELLRWKREFERALADNGFPFYCLEMAPDWCSYVHVSRVYDLRRCEWEVLAALARDAARKVQAKMVWGGDFRVYHPSFWLLRGSLARGVI